MLITERPLFYNRKFCITPEQPAVLTETGSHRAPTNNSEPESLVGLRPAGVAFASVDPSQAAGNSCSDFAVDFPRYRGCCCQLRGLAGLPAWTVVEQTPVWLQSATSRIAEAGRVWAFVLVEWMMLVLGQPQNHQTDRSTSPNLGICWKNWARFTLEN